jgi:hypothetical protein
MRPANRHRLLGSRLAFRGVENASPRLKLSKYLVANEVWCRQAGLRRPVRTATAGTTGWPIPAEQALVASRL